jgi:nitrous oxidase accessory protein NosD
MDSTVIDGRGMGDMKIIFSSNGLIKSFYLYGKENNTWTNGIIWAFTANTLIKVEECKFTETGWGISCVNSSLIAKNLVMNNVRGGFAIGGTIPLNFEVENCLINSIKGIGTGFASESIFHIKNNIILYSGIENPEAGISVGAVKKVYIKNNLISGFSPNIYFDTIVDTSFVENIISVNSNYVFGSVYLRNTMMKVKNNVFQNNQAGLRVFGDPNDEYNLYWKNQTNVNNGQINDSDIIADPMFVNDTIPTQNGSYNFHLQAYSPGIDNGDPNILDLNGTRSDIGKYGGPFGETYTYQDLAPLAPRNLSAVVNTNQILFGIETLKLIHRIIRYIGIR